MIASTPRFLTSLIVFSAIYCSNFFVPAAFAVELHDGLVGYWKLNGNSVDSAGGPDGEVRNAPTWIDGKFNAGVQFDGTSQGIVIPASSALDIGTTGVTVSAWVKLDTLPAGMTGSFGGIYDATADNYVLYLDKGANELRFKATTTGGTSSAAHRGVPASMLDTSNWHHVMGTFDGSAGASKIYFNGNLVDISSVNTTNGLVRAGQLAGIGAQPSAAVGNPLENFFPGAVADVAVWNRSLGLAEAQYLFNGGAGNAVGAANPIIAPIGVTPVQPSAQPVVRYSFDDNLNNSGTGGAAYNAVLRDDPALNNVLFTPTAMGKGLDLRGNPWNSGANPPTGVNSTTTNGDYLSVDYQLPQSGTIELTFTADRFFNFQTLWSNSVHGNAWESWIYSDGRLSARANNSASANDLDFFLPIVGGDDPSKATYHVAYTWERNGAQVNGKLYVDGVLREQAIGPWLDPGATVFIGGGIGLVGGANHLGGGVYDEFRIYDVALTEGEILFRSQAVPEPTSVALAGLGLTLLACGQVRRRFQTNL